MKRTGLRISAGTFFLALGFAAHLEAAQLVTFTRGHSIVVQSSEKRGTWYYFTLEGGGEMGVPLKQVARIEDYEAPPPSAAASAVAAAPAPRPAAIEPPQTEPRNVSLASPTYSEEGNVALDDSGMPEAPPMEGDVAAQADDWRSRVKMNGGRNLAGGHSKKPAGMGRPGAGPQGIMNPFNRRPPNKPPQQPTPPQQ